MGLFRKKKEAIERIRAGEINEIVCLHCFRGFSHDKVLFRALDALIGDGYAAEVDPVLDAYRSVFGMGSAGLMPVVLDTDDFREVRKGYHKGILVSLKDDFDNVTTKRICPYCHNELHQSAGFVPSVVIPVAGGPGTGKSIYFTSLIHQLKAEVPKHFPSFCYALNGDMGKRFKADYEDLLVQDGLLTDIGGDEWQDGPLVFTFNFTERDAPEINIVLFDIGNITLAGAGLDFFASCIQRASGVIFLVDPTQFSVVKDKVNGLDNLPGEFKIEPTDALLSYVYNYIDKDESRVSPIPIAITLTKTDLLDVIRADGVYLRPDSNFFSQSSHKGFFDLTSFMAVDDEVETFVTDMDPGLRSLLKRSFRFQGFFAVSSIGKRPLGGTVSSLAPIRAEEPFLWLMYQLGFIESEESA